MFNDNLPKFYVRHHNAHNIIFGKKNGENHDYPRCRTGFHINGDYSNSWVADFEPICDRCVDRNCNSETMCYLYVLIGKQVMEKMKKQYFEKHPEDKI